MAWLYSWYNQLYIYFSVMTCAVQPIQGPVKDVSLKL